MIIRQAKADDLGPIRSLTLPIKDASKADDATFEKIFLSMLSKSDVHFSVADDGGLVLGYLFGFLYATVYANGPVAWIEGIIVAEHHRTSGVGSLLVGEFEEWALGHGAVSACFATTGASGFFEKLGYTVTAKYGSKDFPSPLTPGASTGDRSEG